MNRVTRRRFLEQLLLASAALSIPGCGIHRTGRTVLPSEVIRVGVIGVRGRGRAHIGEFKKHPDTQVVAICDPDEGVVEGAMKAVPDATYYRDIRKLLEDDSIDVLSIATPNHWHSLATIWSLQAGKHVYVEKPISHNVYEGRRVVEAARRYGLIVQHGTQGRSNIATREAIAWLHAGGLGKVHIARGLCYKRRDSIGKVEGPQKPPATLDYDLWTGPARLEPLRRANLHYDWHWVFNTGNGDIGNQGVHQMDIARWGLGKDELPTRIFSCGGRFGYDDDGETPNTLMVVYDYGDQQLIFEVRGLKTLDYRTAHIGVVFHCEHGYLVIGSYAKALAYDHGGNVVKTFTGDGNHFHNFIEAVKSTDPGVLNAESIEGHWSSALCHLGNIAYRMGTSRTLATSELPFDDNAAAMETFQRMQQHLVENSLVPDKTLCTFSPTLTFDPTSERFTGQHADQANALLSRVPRAPFVIPE